MLAEPPARRRRHPARERLHGAAHPAGRGVQGAVRRAGRHGLRDDRGRRAARVRRLRPCQRHQLRPPACRGRRTTSCASSTSTTTRCRSATVGELLVRAAEPWVITPGYFHQPERDGRGVAQRVVPHRRRVPLRRGRQLLLRRPHQGRHPPARREHLVVRGRGRSWCSTPAVQECAARRRAVGAGRGRDQGVRRRRRRRRRRPRRAARVPRAADAQVHAAPLRGGGRRACPRPTPPSAPARSSSATRGITAATWDREAV